MLQHLIQVFSSSMHSKEYWIKGFWIKYSGLGLECKMSSTCYCFSTRSSLLQNMRDERVVNIFMKPSLFFPRVFNNCIIQFRCNSEAHKGSREQIILYFTCCKCVCHVCRLESKIYTNTAKKSHNKIVSVLG